MFQGLKKQNIPTNIKQQNTCFVINNNNNNNNKNI